MLLVPAELLPTSVTRDEVVALVNTLAKFSTALHYVKELTQMTYAAYFHRRAPIEGRGDAAAAQGGAEDGAAAGAADDADDSAGGPIPADRAPRRRTSTSRSTGRPSS